MGSIWHVGMTIFKVEMEMTRLATVAKCHNYNRYVYVSMGLLVSCMHLNFRVFFLKIQFISVNVIEIVKIIFYFNSSRGVW